MSFRINFLLPDERRWMAGWRNSIVDGSRSVEWYPKRSLTDQDWLKLKQLARKGAVFAQMGHGTYKFEIRIFAHPTNVNMNPELLLIIPCGSLPEKIGSKEEQEVAKTVGRILTHTKTNEEVLRFYGKEIYEPAECCY